MSSLLKTKQRNYSSLTTLTLSLASHEIWQTCGHDILTIRAENTWNTAAEITISWLRSLLDVLVEFGVLLLLHAFQTRITALFLEYAIQLNSFLPLLLSSFGEDVWSELWLVWVSTSLFKNLICLSNSTWPVAHQLRTFVWLAAVSWRRTWVFLPRSFTTGSSVAKSIQLFS